MPSAVLSEPNYLRIVLMSEKRESIKIQDFKLMHIWKVLKLINMQIRKCHMTSCSQKHFAFGCLFLKVNEFFDIVLVVLC